MKIFKIRTNILMAKNQRNYICLLGSALYSLKYKVKNSQKIKIDDINYISDLLTKIDKFNLNIWYQILDNK